MHETNRRLRRLTGKFPWELRGGTMRVKPWIGATLLTIILAVAAAAQDAGTAIQNAQKAMGDVNSIQYSATGKMGGFGQSWHPGGPWHSTVITQYTRTIDYARGSSKEE